MKTDSFCLFGLVLLLPNCWQNSNEIHSSQRNKPISVERNQFVLVQQGISLAVCWSVTSRSVSLCFCPSLLPTLSLGGSVQSIETGPTFSDQDSRYD